MKNGVALENGNDHNTQAKRRDGTIGYTVQHRIKRDGKVVYSESRTFSRKQLANIWNQKRSAELSSPDVIDKLLKKEHDPLFRESIEVYRESMRKAIGKTKDQVLRSVAESWLGDLKCSQITSQALLGYVNGLDNQPQTKGNYLSHIGSVMKIGRPAFGHPLEYEQFKAAQTVGKHMGTIAKSNSRDRLPTLDELGRLLEHFSQSRAGRADSIPMVDICLYALFSTRRSSEITRQTFDDLVGHDEIWVRDMKHPGEKLGNDVLVKLPTEALAIIKSRQAAGGTGRIFPHNADSISAAFTRACQFLGIEDLHFHDLRHAGITRLFEMGLSIPQVAQVSGHRTWTSLKRYTHIRQAGDKYAGWAWMEQFRAFLPQ